MQRARVWQWPSTQAWFNAHASSPVHAQRPSRHSKPLAQSAFWAHSGALTQAPFWQTCRSPQSPSSSQIGPHAPNRQRPSGQSASVSHGFAPVGGQAVNTAPSPTVTTQTSSTAPVEKFPRGEYMVGEGT